MIYDNTSSIVDLAIRGASATSTVIERVAAPPPPCSYPTEQCWTGHSGTLIANVRSKSGARVLGNGYRVSIHSIDLLLHILSAEMITYWKCSLA